MIHTSSCESLFNGRHSKRFWLQCHIYYQEKLIRGTESNPCIFSHQGNVRQTAPRAKKKLWRTARSNHWVNFRMNHYRNSQKNLLRSSRTNSRKNSSSNPWKECESEGMHNGIPKWIHNVHISQNPPQFSKNFAK